MVKDGHTGSDIKGINLGCQKPSPHRNIDVKTLIAISDELSC